MKRVLPYLLPILTIFGFIAYAFINPEITGFATVNQVKISSDIRVRLDPDVVMPEDSIVVVSIDGKESTLTLDEFVKKTGQEFKYEQGSFPELGYTGLGYTGNYNYILTLDDFNLGLVDPKNEYLLEIDVKYRDYLISHSEEVIK